MSLPIGKIEPKLLGKLLSGIPAKDPRVRIGSRIGDDAAVIDFGRTYLIAKTDPITFVADEIEWYSVNINANDIAVMGGVPKWFLATVLLPEGKTTESDVKRMFKNLVSSLKKLNITLCGGHTEITPNLDRPLIIGQMLGEVEKNKLIDKKSIRAGDLIILTKGIAIEGTSIIAREKEKTLKKKFGKEFTERAKSFIKRPGISVIRDARAAMESGRVSAMHDPTEGGLLGGLYELALLSKTGFTIDSDSIYIYPQCETLCRKYNLDPLRLIASGALIVISPPKDAGKIIKNIRKRRIRADIIGEVTSLNKGYKIIKDGKTYPVVTPITDEIGKIF